MKHIKHAVCYVRKSREDELAERRGEDTLAKQREMLTRDVLCRYEFEYDMAEEVASGDSIRERQLKKDKLEKDKLEKSELLSVKGPTGNMASIIARLLIDDERKRRE